METVEEILDVFAVISSCTSSFKMYSVLPLMQGQLVLCLVSTEERARQNRSS